MGRRFTAASSETIIANTAVTADCLAGLSFTYGTLAVCTRRIVDTGTYEAWLGFNTTGEWYIRPDDFPALYRDPGNRQESVAFTVNVDRIFAVTKASGTVDPRSHRYVFNTGTWTQAANTVGSGSVADWPTLTDLRIGSLNGGPDYCSSEIWALGIWQGRVMSDGEVQRLARGRWLESSPSFYVEWSHGREDGDMARTLGRHPVRQSSRTGTSRGANPPPAGFRMSPQNRRR